MGEAGLGETRAERVGGVRGSSERLIRPRGGENRIWLGGRGEPGKNKPTAQNEA